MHDNNTRFLRWLQEQRALVDKMYEQCGDEALETRYEGQRDILDKVIYRFIEDLS